MSIATEITRLQGAKASLKTSIENKGVTVPSNALLDTYSTLVDAIPQGGGSSLTPKDINFYDYDGTLLYAYTFAEVQQLTEMPEPPNHGSSFPYSVREMGNGGWTESLTFIKNLDSPFNVGVNYEAINNTTKLYITIDDNRKTVNYIGKMYQSGGGIAQRLKVNWGDGTSETTVSSQSTGRKVSHTYAQAGSYVVEIKPATTGSTFSETSMPILLGKIDTSTDANMGVIYSSYDCHDWQTNAYYGYNPILTAVELGQYVGIGPAAFSNAVNLKSLVLPFPTNAQPSKAISFDTNDGPSPFLSSYLEFISLPYSFKLNEGSTTSVKLTFDRCRNLKRIVTPSYIENNIELNNSHEPLFRGCQSLVEWIPYQTYSNASMTNTFAGYIGSTSGSTTIYDMAPPVSLTLEKLVIPHNVVSMDNTLGVFCTDLSNTLYETYGKFPLKYLYIPNSLTSISNENFAVFRNLREIHFPSSVTSLNTVILPEISYFYSTTPPTITSLDGAIAKIIYVPSAAVSDYQTAWPDFASIIQAMPS